MRPILITAGVLALATTLAPAPALASCEDEIIGYYAVGGAFDPAELPPHANHVFTIAPDGTETTLVMVRWENARRVISFINGMYVLSYDGTFYQGAGWDGPWEAMDLPSQTDGVELGRATNAAIVRNLADATCHGEVDLDGTPVLKYSYLHHAETPGGQSWWKSDFVAYVDPATGMRVRTEEHALQESWAPEPKDSVRVTTFDPMPGYTIANLPEGDQD